jgi:hypothetical protein
LFLCDVRRHEGVTFGVALSSVFPFNPVMMMLMTVMMKLKHIALVFNLSWRRLRDEVTRPLEPNIKRRVIVTTFKNVKRFLSLVILQKLPTLTLVGRRRPTTKVYVFFSELFVVKTPLYLILKLCEYIPGSDLTILLVIIIWTKVTFYKCDW